MIQWISTGQGEARRKEASQYLVPPEPAKEKFGAQEILAALIFALFVAGVSFIQFRHTQRERAYIESQVREIPKGLAGKDEAAKTDEKISQLFQPAPAPRASGEFELYFVFGASVFFLTATVLFFFNHGINKISFFMTGVTKRIVYIYLSAMAVIILILHLAPPGKQIFAMHFMLITACAADTCINRIISVNFRHLSDNYKELAKIFRLGMVSGLILLSFNSYVVLQEFLWERTRANLPIINPYRWNLILLVALQLLAMLVLRDLIREGGLRLVMEGVRRALPQVPGRFLEGSEDHV